MNHWLSASLCAACLATSAASSAQSDPARRTEVPAQCADIAGAFEPLEQSLERAYQKLIIAAQSEINALIAELASAKGAKKQELIRNIEASEAQVLSLRAQLGKAKAELDKAKTKALKACVSALEAPPKKPSLAERCGAASTSGAGNTHVQVRLTGDNAAQRRKAAELIATELGAKLVTTTLDRLVRANPLESVAQIESIVAESAKAPVVLLAEERSDASPSRASGGRPLDLREALQTFLNARLARFGGIFLLGADFGSQPSSAKLPRTAVINATTDGRVLATMICRAPSAPPAKP
jgi:hypothetical protein